MPTPYPRRALSYDPREKSVRAWAASVESGPTTYCRIGHVGYGITGMPENSGDVFDHIEIADNDIHDVDGSGIFLNPRHHWLMMKKAIVRFVHLNVLRNRLQNVGSRVVEPKARGRDTINIQQIEELYQWEFDGPFLKDFHGRPVQGICRDAGAVEYAGSAQ